MLYASLSGSTQTPGKGPRGTGRVQTELATPTAGERRGVQVARRRHRYPSLPPLPQGTHARGDGSAADTRSSGDRSTEQRVCEVGGMIRGSTIRGPFPTGGKCSQAAPITAWEPLTGPDASAIVGCERKLRDLGPVGRNDRTEQAIFEIIPRLRLGSAGYKPHRPVS